MICRPLWGYVLVKPLDDNHITKEGIRLVSNLHKPVITGEVIEIGSGSLAIDGSPIEMEVPLKSTVMFEINKAIEVEIEGDNYYIIEQRDILCVI